MDRAGISRSLSGCAALGLHAGMAVAQAQAMVPGAPCWGAMPEEDEATLRELARWAIGYSPVVAPDPPEASGSISPGARTSSAARRRSSSTCSAGSTSRALPRGRRSLTRPGAAWAVARFRAAVSSRSVVRRGRGHLVGRSLADPATNSLPCTGSVWSAWDSRRHAARALVRRFGNDVALRLDQAMDHAFEPINPLIPKETPTLACLRGAHRQARGAQGRGAAGLPKIVRQLAQPRPRRSPARPDPRGRSEGRLPSHRDREGQRDASTRQSSSTSDCKPSIQDSASRRSSYRQQGRTSGRYTSPSAGILVCQDAARRTLATSSTDSEPEGRHENRVYRLAPVQTLVPERMTRKVPALAPATGAIWPENLPRPTRLLDPPEPVVATALLPDHPPAVFVWRKVRHKVVRGRRPGTHHA